MLCYEILGTNTLRKVSKSARDKLFAVEKKGKEGWKLLIQSCTACDIISFLLSVTVYSIRQKEFKKRDGVELQRCCSTNYLLNSTDRTCRDTNFDQKGLKTVG